MRLLYYSIGLGSIISIVGMYSDLRMFIDLPSLLIVVFPPLALSSAMYSLNEVIDSFRAVLTNGKIDRMKAHQAIYILKSIRSIARAMAMVSPSIGAVIILLTLDDPSVLGPSIAVAILSFIYGIILAELIIGPLEHRAQWLYQQMTDQ